LPNLGRPREFDLALESHKKQSLPELRNPVPPSINDAFLDAVSKLFEGFNDASQDEHVAV
jgi:hypothetical protein